MAIMHEVAASVSLRACLRSSGSRRSETISSPRGSSPDCSSAVRTMPIWLTGASETQAICTPASRKTARPSACPLFFLDFGRRSKHPALRIEIDHRDRLFPALAPPPLPVERDRVGKHGGKRSAGLRADRCHAAAVTHELRKAELTARGVQEHLLAARTSAAQARSAGWAERQPGRWPSPPHPVPQRRQQGARQPAERRAAGRKVC